MSFFTRNSQLPIGAVVGWIKTFSNTPSIPANFVECNGQSLSEGRSPYNGQTIPDLNNNGGGDTKKFLKGNSSSGSTGGAESHCHYIDEYGYTMCDGSDFSLIYSVDDYSSTDSHLPPYYEVVWVVRVF